MSEAQSKEALQAQLAGIQTGIESKAGYVLGELGVRDGVSRVEALEQFAKRVEQNWKEYPARPLDEMIERSIVGNRNLKTGQLMNPQAVGDLRGLLTQLDAYHQTSSELERLGVPLAVMAEQRHVPEAKSVTLAQIKQAGSQERQAFDTAMRQALAEQEKIAKEQGNIAKVIADTVVKHQNEISEPAALTQEINGAIASSQHQIQGDVLNAFGKVSQQQGFEGLAGITQAERAEFVSAYAKEHQAWLEATAKAAQAAVPEAVSAGTVAAETPAPNAAAETPAAGEKANTGSASPTSNTAATDTASKTGEKAGENAGEKASEKADGWFAKTFKEGEKMRWGRVSLAVAAGVGGAYVINRIVSNDEPEKPETRVMADGRQQQFQRVQPRAQGAGMSMGAAG